MSTRKKSMVIHICHSNTHNYIPPKPLRDNSLENTLSNLFFTYLKILCLRKEQHSLTLFWLPSLKLVAGPFKFMKNFNVHKWRRFWLKMLMTFLSSPDSQQNSKNSTDSDMRNPIYRMRERRPVFFHPPIYILAIGFFKI